MMIAPPPAHTLSYSSDYEDDMMSANLCATVFLISLTKCGMVKHVFSMSDITAASIIFRRFCRA